MKIIAAFLMTVSLMSAQEPVDKSVDPCVDFYQYACGVWMKQNPIPPDQPEWGSFTALQQRNLEILRNILEDAAKAGPSRDATEQKIGDYYAGCMDEAAIERRGISPLQPDLDRIAAISDKSQIAPELVRLHRIGVTAVFAFSSSQDFKNSSQEIAEVDQDGLGMPDRDYYLKDDGKFAAIRKKYVAYLQKVFELLGDAPTKAAPEASVVMTIETALAKGSLDRVSLRDPVKVYHMLTTTQLTDLAPSFRWAEYLRNVGAPRITSLNIAEPEFLRTFENVLKDTSLDNWKTYLRWHLAERAPMMPKAFVDAHFDFFGRTLAGVKELPPRWKRCVEGVDAQLGEALGKEFVARTFGPQAKQRTLNMVHELEAALGEDITHLDWMSPATKEQALIKLHAITNKIGYPDKWRDYSRLQIVPGDAFGNAIRGREFEFQRQLDKIGKPVDRGEWQMTPPTVNAYYDPQMNNINFPAGILQPPFFDNKRGDADNLGAIGAVIGHELTHGFDDQGRQFDAHGNLRDWWTTSDAKAFQERAECFVKEYSSFTAVDDVKLNGELTLGENTADNGGLRIAYMALLKLLDGQADPKTGDYTPLQRFFLSYGQVWCANESDAYLHMAATVDPHSPAKDRVNGVVSNMPEFQKAFSCHVGQPMVRRPACRVW
ncbi:MAG TPA: M13 family metallopeptidase [Bryobacteraceae bacterium]|nr:M13 family metallopeptidase [Bryobacteraceae bacterium]